MNAKDEFYLWDLKGLSQLQRRKANRNINKIELINDDCYILYKNGNLEIWNVESGEFRKSDINYPIQDFSTDGKRILIIGEGFMQMTALNKV